MTLSLNNQSDDKTVAALLELLDSTLKRDEEDKPVGIGSKPAGKKGAEDDSVVSFFGEMFNSAQSKAASAKEEVSALMAEEARRSAVEVAAAREMVGLKSSLAEGGGEAGRDKLPEGTTLRPVARPDIEEVSNEDGVITALYSGADGVQPSGGKAPTGLMSKPVKGIDLAITEATDIVADKIGLTPEMWQLYREEVSAIESGGEANPYAAKGGANNHYDGMYQLGKVAKQDAADLLGIKLGHTAKDREAYRNNPALQEKAFAAYTAKNHAYLMNKSKKYRAMPIEEKLAVLGYAHNQGWGGANKWLNTGVAGKDAFGTKGTKYYNAIKTRQNP